MMRKKGFAVGLLVHCIILLIFCQEGAVFAADSQDFYFDSFVADYYLSREADGTSALDVDERLVAVFPDFDQNHGIVRSIPTTNQGGKNFVMDPKTIDIDVLRNGEREIVDRVEGDNSYHAVYVGSPDTYVRGRQEYELTYGFSKVITQQDGHQELYWDTNGTGFSQRFDGLSVRVHLDKASLEGWTGQAWCYVGVEGANDQSRCSWREVDSGVVEFAVDGAAQAGENLTYVLSFADGTFVVPAVVQDFTVAALGVAGVGFSVAILIVMLMIWAHYRGKYKRWEEIFVAPEYQPIRNMTVAEACMLSTSAIPNYSLPASLVELAVLGKIKLEEDKTKILKRSQWKIRVVSLAGLSAAQLHAIEIVNHGAEVAVGDVIELKARLATTKLAAATKAYKTDTETALRDKHLWVKSKTANFVLLLPSVHVVLGVILLVIMAGAAGAYGVEVVLPELLLPVGFVGFVVAIVIEFALGRRINKVAERTDEGLKMERRLLGLRDYIKLAEADRIKVLQSVKGAERINTKDNKVMIKLYEKLLPYAIIFGLEKSWGRELEKYYAAAGDGRAYVPAWYVGAHAFSPSHFASEVHSFTSSVSSSAGSGAGGGGFSGGGGGGGGGGGW